MADPLPRTEADEALRFAALVAHQLKSPIGAAGSLLKTVLAEYAGALAPRQKDLLARADRRLEEAVETVRRMMAVVRPELHVNAATAVGALLARLSESAQDLAAARRIALTAEMQEAAPIARAAEEALAEAVQALLANALKYTPDHGSVRLRAGPSEDPARLRIEVADSGPGVPEAERARIFQPFYRSPAARDSAQPGVGLGLALVKALVESMGGEIRVGRSDLGGASFVLSVPRAPAMEPNAPPRRRVVIIGGIAAGPKVAAKVIRSEPDTEVTIVERGDVLSYSGCGLPYYIGGTVRDQRDLLATPLGAVRDSVFFQSVKNVRVLNRTEALEIDRPGKRVRVKPAAGGPAEWICYDKLVLATGSAPILPALPGADLRNIFTLHGMRDAEGIRGLLDRGGAHDVVLVGGGLIGVEMTEALAARGCRVTIVEQRDEILQILDDEMAQLLTRHMESHGVRVLNRTTATAFVGEGGAVRGVQTDRGLLPADLVILGVGVRPEATLARQAGLDLGRTGAIKVDQRLQTSDPDIFAAGDCAECVDLITGQPCFIPLGSTANKQGRVAAINLCGGTEAFPGVLGTTICKVFDYCVARTGLTERDARAAGMTVVTALSPAPDREHFMPGARYLFLKVVVDCANRRLVGVQVVGPGAGDKRIDVAATAITAGMTADQVARLDLAYAPPYAPAVDNLITAVNIARNKLGGGLRGISPRELKQRLDRRDDLLLLDVSTSREYEELRLPGSQLIPLGALRDRLGELPRDRDIVTFCRLSIRGYEAAIILGAAGFERVWVLDGGLLMWPYDKVQGRG